MTASDILFVDNARQDEIETFYEVSKSYPDVIITKVSSVGIIGRIKSSRINEEYQAQVVSTGYEFYTPDLSQEVRLARIEATSMLYPIHTLGVCHKQPGNFAVHRLVCKACQRHRDYYRGYPKANHPLTFFLDPEFMWQCPPEMTATYFKFPMSHVMYKQPAVLPAYTGRTSGMPALPDRTLGGRFNKAACKAFVR